MDATSSAERVHLDFVAVHFSTRCGAKCSFCYSLDPLAGRFKPTPLDNIRKILPKLACEGVSDVLFVGGDPVVHPNFIESLEIAKSVGLSTSVLSNSWAIKPDSEFNRAVALIDSCEATILGATSETHDLLTQVSGSFTCLIRNLQRVATCGKSVGVCANAMPQNLNQIYDIVVRVQREFNIPVRGLMIQRIIPSGGASGDFKFGLNLQDVEKLMIQIDRVHNEFQVPIYFEDPVPWCTVDSKYHKYLAKCHWGYTRGSISNNGLLNRCGADDNYRLGSIWEGNVQDVWRNHPILVSFRSKEYLPDECKTCDLLDKCGGGCPLSCGTLKDHDVDQLYIQRIEQKAVGAYTPNSPAGSGYFRPTVRFAYKGDLARIVQLESEIFGNAGPLFQEGKIEAYFEKCPKAFRVIGRGADILGYSVLFPMNNTGVSQVRKNRYHSVLEMELSNLAERFVGQIAGLYLEVIATVPDTPRGARFALIKDLVSTIRKYQLPVYTCPISSDGLRLAREAGFVALDGDEEGSVFVLNLGQEPRKATINNE